MEIENQNNETVQEQAPSLESEQSKPASFDEYVKQQDGLTQKQMSDILELDKFEKFKFGGKEITKKDLEEWQKGYMRQTDYTKKTQEVSEQRKYVENIRYDLKKVLDNPSLADEFKSVYPKEYHEILDALLTKEKAANPEPAKEVAEQKPAQISDPRLDEVYNFYKEQEYKAVKVEIDRIFDSLSQKYPRANESEVITLAQGLRAKGEKLDEKTYEELFKDSHAKIESLFKQWQSDQVKAQKQVNTKSKDVGAGGGVPGAAPKVAKNIKEAGDLFFEHLQNQN